jgi:hypothetical protein
MDLCRGLNKRQSQVKQDENNGIDLKKSFSVIGLRLMA